MEDVERFNPVWKPEGDMLCVCSYLELNNRGLEAFPDSMSTLFDLKSLEIRGNRISTIPGWISKLTKLESLYIENNQLTSLPTEFFSLTKLYLIHMGKNKISTLPINIFHMKKLIYLEAEENEFTSIPREISLLRKLSSLMVGKNKLSNLPSKIYKLQNLQELSFHENSIKTLSNKISQLTMLTYLNGSLNQLKSLPEEVIFLSKMKNLNVSGNSLVYLPEGLSHMYLLKELDISKNRISKISEGLLRLTVLTILSIFSNNLSTLPNGLSLLRNLRIFLAHDNKLTEFPMEMTRLEKLEKCNMKNNLISQIPSWISHLTNLTFFDVSNNQLTRIPIEFCNLQKLKEFVIEDAEGNTSILLAPRSLSSLPCWINDAKPYPDSRRTCTEALRRLVLYEDGGWTAPSTSRGLITKESHLLSDISPPTDIKKIPGYIKSEDLDKLQRFGYSEFTIMGSSAFGTTMKAKLSHGRIVAFKFLKKDAVLDPKIYTAIAAEAILLNSLSNDNLCAYINYTRFSDVSCYILEFIQGCDLWSRINSDGPLPIDVAIKYAVQITNALVFLHEQNPSIQHGFLKPENVLLVDDMVKITDYGLLVARAAVRRIGLHSGELCYVPPELFLSEIYTNASDIYSFGLVLWTMLSGVRPFDGCSREQITLGKKQKQIPVSLENFPIKVSQLIKHCCSFQPPHRPSAAQNLIRLADMRSNTGPITQQHQEHLNSMEEMNPVELSNYLSDLGYSSIVSDVIAEERISGGEFFSLTEKDLKDHPFNLPKATIRVILNLKKRA